MSSYCMNIYFGLFCLMLSLQHISEAVYSFQCPTQSHWRHREGTYCNYSSSYFCLYDLNENNFTEMCREESEIEKAGYKQIVSGSKHGTLQGDICEKDLYQPFKFNSSGNSRCVYQKSHCSEEGQIIHSNGTIKANRECRCDYTRGYDFLHRPKNQCFCEPSEEDCSCYLKICSFDGILSPDYECLVQNEWKNKFNCVPKNNVDNTDATSTVIFTDEDINREGKADSVLSPALTVALKTLVCIAVVCVLIFGFSLTTRQVQDGKFIPSLLRAQMGIRTRNYGLNTNKIKCMIPSYLLGLQEKKITKWRRRHEHFYVSVASKTVLKTVKTDGFVMISGSPGSGKSAIAYNTAFMLEQNADFTILVCSSPEDIRTNLWPGTKQIFLIDDPIGKYTVDNLSIQQWKNEETFIEQTFTHSSNTKLILTCRSYIYKSGFSRKLNLSPVHCDLLSHTFKMNVCERVNICKKYDIPDLNDEIIMMYEFFPLLCALYTTNDDSIMYFTNPYKVLTDEMMNIKETSDIDFLAIALLVVQNNNIDRQLFSLENNTIKELLNDMCNECGFKYFPSIAVLHAALNHSIGTYIMKNDNGLYTIRYSTIFRL